MDCKKIKELLLTDYSDGLLSGDGLRDVESHIKACPKCRKLAADLASARNVFGAVRPEAAPPELWSRIKGEIIAEKRSPAYTVRPRVMLPDLFFRFRPVMAAAAVAVMLVFVLTSANIISRYSSMPTGAEQDDVFAMASSDWNGEDQVYYVGTAEEEYFL